jgi:hypothetical protein
MTINQAISSIILKILIGVVLSSIMIISFLNLSQDLHEYLERFENYKSLQFCVFSFFLLSAGTGLFLLFRKKSDAEIESDMTRISKINFVSFDFYSLGVKFLEGFVNGASKETGTINKNINDSTTVKG